MPQKRAILRLKRNKNREWEIDGDVADLPGGLTPVDVLRPIIVSHGGHNVVTWANKGFVDPNEEFAYVMERHVSRDYLKDEVSSTDFVEVKHDAKKN